MADAPAKKTANVSDKPDANKADADGTDDAPKNRKQYIVPAIAIANFLLLVGLAMYLIPGRSDTEETPADAVEEVPLDALQIIAEGDAMLRAGRYDDARKRYVQASQLSLSDRAVLEYRLGLNAEFNNELDDALEHYRQTRPQFASEVSCATLLGVARVLYKQGQYHLAANTVSQLVAIGTLPVLTETRLGPHVAYAHALLVAAEATERILPPEMTAEKHLFPHRLDRSLEELLQLVPLEGNQVVVQRPNGDGVRSGILIQRLGETPFATLLSCHFESTTSIQLLEMFASRTGWKISITPDAHEMLTAKRIMIQVNDKTAAELLSLVLEPQRLFWSFEADNLIIDRIENFNRDLVTSYQIRRANARLLDAVAEAPNDTLAPEAYLALGNLATVNEQLQRATTYYQEIIQRYPRHATAQLAEFNLAKAAYRIGNFKEAQDYFYRVADRRSSTDVRALAYLYLGRSHLDYSNWSKAKRMFSRSVAMAQHPEVQAHGALSLAASYLLSDSDGASAAAANSILMEHRDLLREAQWMDMTSYLSALTRFRVALRPGDLKRRAEEVISAAVHVDPNKFFGEFGFLLVGDSFAEMSLPSEALRAYELGVRKAQGKPIQGTLLYRMAEEYRNYNELEDAISILQRLSNLPKDPLASSARVELADIMISNGEFDRCIDYCREALRTADTEEDQKKLLGALGRAYQELGRYEEASKCFMGFLPNPEPGVIAKRNEKDRAVRRKQ